MHIVPSCSPPHAKSSQADMVLLAGDIFHDNKPSRRAMQRALEVMRDHCLGDREVQIEVVSDPNTNFHNKYKTVNYEDPNYNVQLPVFAIHGNHDDPAGDGGLAPLDLLSSANLVNYFGRARDIENIVLSPILLKKGATRLALYGLGHVRDERLSRCFERKTVKVAKPQDSGSWFNILAVHQNRHVRGVMGAQGIKKGYIKEAQLPSCMDLVIWGHEHECQIGSGMNALQGSSENQFTVIQPGSTVATSLVEGEAKPKHVALLQVHREQWKLDALPLASVRPFAIRDVCLEAQPDDTDLSSEEAMMDFLEEQAIELIEELAARQVSAEESADGRTTLPLIRLRVDYTGFSTCNPQKFGQRFVSKVANPGEILLFQRKAKKQPARSEADSKSAAEAPTDREDASAHIQHILTDFLHGGKEQLRLLSQQDLNTAVFEDYVGRDNKGAIAQAILTTLTKTQEFLAKQSYGAVDRNAKELAIEDMLFKRKAGSAKGAAAGGRAAGAAAGAGAGGGGREADGGDVDVENDVASCTGGRAGGRGGAAARNRGVSHGGTAPAAGGARRGTTRDDGDSGADDLFDDDDDDGLGGGGMDNLDSSAAAAPKARGRGKSRGAAASARGASAQGRGTTVTRGRGARQTKLNLVGGSSAASAVDIDDDDDTPPPRASQASKRATATTAAHGASSATGAAAHASPMRPAKRGAASAATSRMAKAQRTAASTNGGSDYDDDDEYIDDADNEVSTAAPSSRTGGSFANPRRRYK
uniref:Double-strand break repair protein n=1 Tax=Chrysotila carterae TaxID=13221 RepID=A0A7S4F0M6_CHRCT